MRHPSGPCNERQKNSYKIIERETRAGGGGMGGNTLSGRLTKGPIRKVAAE